MWMEFFPDGDPETRLLKANEEFYQTFESLDPTAMADIWVPDDSVVCILPGWPMIRGWNEVYTAWESFMKHIEGVQFIITGVRASAHEGVGWVSCVQNTIRTLGDKMAYSTVNAVNVYRFQDDENRWRMVVYNASHVLSTGT
jgi:hypothetical protein